MNFFKTDKIPRSKKNGCFFKTVWLVLLCLISALLARYAIVGINDMLAVGRSEETVQIEVPERSSLDTIARILKENKVINEKGFFKLYARVTKSSKKFLPGLYELRTNMDYQEILNHIKNQSNIKDISEITITEGMNALEIAEILEKNHICAKDDFLTVCKSGDFDANYDFIRQIDNSSERIYKLEGYLFPDTYKFYKGEKPKAVIGKLLSNCRKKIINKNKIEGYGDKISIKELAEQKGISQDKLINIAALIQAEAANKDDMYKVSSVIYNRLKTLEGSKVNEFGEFSLGTLRIDSTTYYPYRNKAALPKEYSKSYKSTYDTYSSEGLPPGPICNPGIDAIMAALNPAQTDFYYYCHSASGEAFYAKTNDAHIANLKKAGL